MVAGGARTGKPGRQTGAPLRLRSGKASRRTPHVPKQSERSTGGDISPRMFAGRSMLRPHETRYESHTQSQALAPGTACRAPTKPTANLNAYPILRTAVRVLHSWTGGTRRASAICWCRVNFSYTRMAIGRPFAAFELRAMRAGGSVVLFAWLGSLSSGISKETGIRDGASVPTSICGRRGSRTPEGCQRDCGTGVRGCGSKGQCVRATDRTGDDGFDSKPRAGVSERTDTGEQAAVGGRRAG